jgi:predicted nucleotidyltransferase
MNPDKIHLPSQLIEPFCQKHHICSLAIFGSFARDDFRPDSDLDILVDFEPGHTPGFNFFLLESELSELLGRKVDLQTASFLSPGIRQSVLSEAVIVYEQA